jgi:hypothetical protein
MNTQEAHQLVTIIRAAYPTFYKEKQFDEESFKMQRDIWAECFADCTFEEVFVAFNAWLATEPFPPTIAHINNIVKRAKKPEAFESAERAWEKVHKAVVKFGWCNQEKAYATLSPNIQRAIQYIGGWRRLCSAEGKEWDFRRKDFIDVFEEFEEKTQKRELIPTEVLKRLNKEAALREEAINDKVKYLANKNEMS